MKLEKIKQKTLQAYRVEYLPDEMGVVYPAFDASEQAVYAKKVTRSYSGELVTETLPKWVTFFCSRFWDVFATINPVATFFPIRYVGLGC